MQAGQQCAGEHDDPVNGADEWPAGPALVERRTVLEGTPHQMNPFRLMCIIPDPGLNVELLPLVVHLSRLLEPAYADSQVRPMTRVTITA
jgi:hypothetical protein